MRVTSHRAITWVILFSLLLAGLPAGLHRTAAAPGAQIAPLTSHPRLWITADDLPRLRSWATDANPLYRDGLAVLAETRKAEMDAGTVPAEDGGSYLWEEYPTEGYAEFFAFMSLISPDETARTDYAQRARTLLMHAIDEAIKGPLDEAPFRDPEFATSDRSRWWGEAWGLTVDWIYPVLSSEDKAAIRTVFLRWANEIQTSGYHHPGVDDESLLGVTDDPRLTADKNALRWSGNNYFTGNMRNLGLMAMALDEADDPGGELHAYLKIAIGAHLYMVDDLFRTDSAGGLAPEGFEYGPQTMGYVAQFLLALHTAGQDDPAVWGPQVVLANNPFWDQVIPAYLNSLSPKAVIVPTEEYRGPLYLPAWYGDGGTYWGIDFIEFFGALGRLDDLSGNTKRLDALRWIEAYLPPGGTDQLISERVGDAEDGIDAILYFLLFDPSAPAPTDPHDTTPLLHYAPGLGRLLVRTGWDDSATWFTYALSWNEIDHQHGDGNSFGFYRNGEWLTKILIGYGTNFNGNPPYAFPSSEYNNTLALENDPPAYNDPDDPRHSMWLRGSQWMLDPAGDPTILGLSVAPGYVYALGDATPLYNSDYEGMHDITQANRSIVWLAPDVIVVYDRATSKSDGRFKRFWLNLPADATVVGNRTTMTSAGGQQLIATLLQPVGAVPSVQPLDIGLDDIATGEPMRYRYLVEAPNNPKDVRFLNVLQAADAGIATAPVAALESDDHAFAGTVVGSTAVLFPVDLNPTVTTLRYTVPTGTTAQLVTGLPAGSGYDVTTAESADGIAVTITPGSTFHADAGGVLLVGSLPAVLNVPAVAFTNTPAAVPAGTATATPSDVTESGTPESATVTPEATMPSVVEGGAAGTGSGEIVYTVFDGHTYRVVAKAGAVPEDLTLAMDAMTGEAATAAPVASPVAAPAQFDSWATISPDGKTLLMGTERFDPECAGWACLAVVAGDLSSGEAVRTDGSVIHPEGPGAITGDLVVYPDDGGPHQIDLWAIHRQGNGWSAPQLLTGASPYAYHANPSLSDDGSHVLFDCANEPYGAAGTAICEVGADGAGFRVAITPADAPPGVPAADGALTHARYQADGGIVFEADWGSDSLWRLAPGATEPVHIGAGFNNDNTPCVLPDGRIASLWLDRAGGAGVHELKVMTPDGISYAMIVTGVDIEEISCGG